MEAPGLAISLFTDLATDSPSYGATISLLDEELSEPALLAHLANKRAQFSASAL